MIDTEYTITYTDYKNAHWLYLKNRPVAMIGYVFFGLGIANIRNFSFGLDTLVRNPPESGLH